MEKFLVVLFPQEEYLGTEMECIPLFNECIKKRYTDKGYKIKVVNYKDSKGFVNLLNVEKIEADITFEESSPYFIEDVKQPNFEQIAISLNIENADEVRVCGFHCFDCVEKLAKAIYQLNQNVIIDTDFTEMFPSRIRLGDFDIENFDVDFKVNLMFELEGEAPSQSTLRIVNERYSHPIWGISSELLNKIKSLQSLQAE